MLYGNLRHTGNIADNVNYINRKNSIAIKSITIDGDGSDWNDIRPILMDKKRDVSNNKTIIDITKVYLPMGSKYLYVRADFVKGLPVTNKDDYTRECLI